MNLHLNMKEKNKIYIKAMYIFQFMDAWEPTNFYEERENIRAWRHQG